MEYECKDYFGWMYAMQNVMIVEYQLVGILMLAAGTEITQLIHLNK